MKGHIGKTILTEAQIRTRIAELGHQITQEYSGSDSLICIGILKGSFIFMADLVREINLPALTTEFMKVSSYGDSTTSSGIVQILLDVQKDIAGKHVLIVEDIVDTCLTMKYLINMLSCRKPASIKVCSLIRKDNAKVDVTVDYLGFELDPNAFVIGYGLDCAEKYRNLPYVAEFVPE